MKKVFAITLILLFFICGCHSHSYEKEWMYDEIYHYHKAICCDGEVKDLDNHQLIEDIIIEPTHNRKGEAVYMCSICDYYRVEELETIAHTYGDEYYYDSINHYNLCTCGKKGNIEEHNYKEGEIVIEGSKYSTGLQKYTCECGSVKEEVIDSNTYEIDKDKESIYLITTSAGSDISTSVGISWHSKKSGSFLVYKKEGTKEFKEVKPNEEYWSLEENHIVDAYQEKRYVCTVDLKGLEPNSKYIYKIVSDEVMSNELSFKTADNSASKYSFLSFVDFQYSENEKTLNLVKLFTKNNPDANLITCSGDITDEGYKENSHRYLFDTEVFSNSILAFGAGDHEYWGTGSSPIIMMKRPYSYNRLFNNPKNGCEGYLNSSYYFNYNSSLFVFLDCGDSNVSGSNEMFSKQAEWLDNVLSTQTYEFVIVCMHKSLYGDPKQDGAIKKMANVLTPVFDKYNVDLVISGHDHEYSRTNSLYNGQNSNLGTVYLDLGNSGSKTRATGEDIKNSNLYAKYIDIKENNYSLGIVGTVENDKLTIKVLNQNYTIVDEVIIDKKERLL